MQVTLDAASLKPFTKALTCLSKYSDELLIFATPDRLSLSATNSSESAYCRFKYTKRFFSRYNVGARQSGSFAEDVEEVTKVTGQLLTKSLLTILKHRTVEKSVDRCELSIVEGVPPNSEQDHNEEIDSLESRLVVRLHCKHGVIKTHRLPLHTASAIHSFDSSPRPSESQLSIGPKALKDMIDHFPSVKGNKGDPQLVWSFGDSEVEIKSLETSIDTKGKAQLATELMISAAEFEHYEIHDEPITIAFQLREFNATVSFADSVQATLNLRFTEPSAPLVIEVETDDTETLFAISTSHIGHAVRGSQQSHNPSSSSLNSRKRQRDTDEGGGVPSRTSETPSVRRKPAKIVQRQDLETVARTVDTARNSRTTPPLSLPFSQHQEQELEYTEGQPLYSQLPAEEPLFLPATQLSAADEEMLRSTGLGIENMTAAELEQMMEEEDGDDLEEIPPTQREGLADFELFDDTELEATQNMLDELKAFKPLFED